MYSTLLVFVLDPFSKLHPIAQNPQEGIFIQKLFWTRVKQNT